jgi:hypothetical protein
MSLFDTLSPQFLARYRPSSLSVMRNHLRRILDLLKVKEDASAEEQLEALLDLPRVSELLLALTPSSAKAIANTINQILIDKLPTQTELLHAARLLLRELDARHKDGAELRPPTAADRKVLEEGYTSMFKAVPFDFTPPPGYDPAALKTMQGVAAAALYRYLPPIRPEVYVSVRLGSPPEDEDEPANYYDQATGSLHIRTYKTSATHGPYELRLPHALQAILRTYISTLRASPELPHLTYLFPNLRSGEPLTTSGLLSILRRAMANLTINTSRLRSLYITENAPHLDAEGRRLLALAMGHSLATQLMTYERYEPADAE